MELYSEADKTIWEEKYMPVSLKKGQKVSLTKGNPGLKNVVVGIGWDINAFDTGGDFDLDAAAFCLTDSGRVSDSNDFVFYGNLVHPSGAVQHMGDNLTGAGDGDDEQIKIDLSKIPANITKIAFTATIYDAETRFVLNAAASIGHWITMAFAARCQFLSENVPIGSLS